ncbi:hypothetical protein ACFO9E_27540 [Streptomyces maoxianensis]|uniref:Secreted protein n=1 Tax=Streptomyces maoxianensis TaxID=1459942 RepID=A0ABV9GFX2_9ACTN
MNKVRKTAAAIAGAAVLVGLGALPAHAENYRDTSLTGWTPGKESTRWTDNNRDAASTSVRFADCHSDGGDGFKRANLKLWKDVFGPDENKGTKTNYCNTVGWGDQSAGSYYFELDSFTSGGVLTVKSIRISW